jgi:hypothetical protein
MRIPWQMVLAAQGALLLLALVWLFGAGPAPAVARPAGAPAALSVITGTVSWKENQKPASGVRVILKDQRQGVVVGEAVTDPQGVYTLTTGVGSWTVDVPSTSRYWGYSQLMVALPHDDYHLDFGITVRPPEAPQPTPQPGAPTPPALTPQPGGTPEPGAGGAHIPPAGHPSAGPAGVVLAAAALALLGWALRRHAPARREDRS